MWIKYARNLFGSFKSRQNKEQIRKITKKMGIFGRCTRKYDKNTSHKLCLVEMCLKENMPGWNKHIRQTKDDLF